MFIKNSQNRQLIDEILKNLKENKGKAVEIITTANSKPEVTRDVNLIRTLMRKMDQASELGNVGFVINDIGNNKFRVFAYISDNARKKGAGKAKKGAKTHAPAHPAEGAQPERQAMSVEEMKNQMLQTVNSMPVQSLPMFLPQYQAFLEQKQKQLSAPDITETAAGRLKEEIQMTREIIEVINKKLGK